MTVIGNPHTSEKKDFRGACGDDRINLKEGWGGDMVIYSAVDHVTVFVMLSDGEAYIVLMMYCQITMRFPCPRRTAAFPRTRTRTRT